MKRKFKYRLFLFVLILFSIGCKPSKQSFESFIAPVSKNDSKMSLAPKVTHIPGLGTKKEVTIWQNIPFTEVQINNEGPFLFAIDTGVSGLMISSELSQKLKLTVSPKDINIILDTPTGKTNLGRSFEVESVSIGDAIFHQIEAAKIPSNALDKYELRFDGILGLGLFQDCILELDYINKYIKLIEPKDTLDIAAKHIVPAVFTNKGIFVKGAINNKIFTFQLDTGSSYGISISREHEKELMFLDEKKTTILGTLNGTQKVTIATLDGNAVFDHFSLKDPLIYISTKNLLGGEVFKNCILRIYPNEDHISIRQETNNHRD